uniref:Guanylate cyclase n=1 Tax=Panagrolaimus sp. JU765 TaxID=591449 RepID=A0AC34Q8K7_9BILA
MPSPITVFKMKRTPLKLVGLLSSLVAVLITAQTSTRPATTPTTLRGIGPVNLKVGMMFPKNESNVCAYQNSAAAVTIAVDRIFKDKLLPPGSNISFVWRYEECVEATAIGYAYELIVDEQVDFLFVPPCMDAAILASHVGTYFNIPIGLWGITFATTLADAVMYPTILSVVPNYRDLAQVTCEMMKTFGWQQFSFIYQSNENGGCSYYNRDFEAVVNSRNDCIVSYKDVFDEKDMDFTIQQIQLKSRIVVLCFDDEDLLRPFALKLFDYKMYSPDYVYLLADSDMSKAAGLDGLPFWFDKTTPSDGRNADAALVGQRFFQLHVDMSSNLAESITDFSDEVMARMDEWPFYCSDCNHGQNASIYAIFLYDAMYAYGFSLGNAINVTQSSDPTIYRNGTLLCTQVLKPFQGMTGTVAIGVDGVRNSIYAMSAFNSKNKLQPFIYVQIVDNIVNVTLLYSDPATTIWASRNGVKPLDVPICGFTGKNCPTTAFEEYKGYFIAAIVVAAVIVLSIFGACAYMINMRFKDIAVQNRMWQVSFQNLVKYNARKAAMESMRSLQSGPSTTSTKFTFDSMKSSKNFSMFTHFGERVIGYKHVNRLSMEKEDISEYRQMRGMDHDNINRFVGLCLDGPEVLSIWRFCSRGSLRDVIQNNTLNMDAFFVFSLIRDVVEGLHYLHASFLGCHGYLKSSYCLVDDRWQVKLSNYGLKSLRKTEARKAKDQLWTAPELIRDSDHSGTKQGDVYSLAIICSEIINMKPPWEPSETKGNPEEIVYLVKKGGVRPLRPLIQPAVTDLNPALLHLVRDCWAENAHERPKVETVRSLLKSMVTGRTNLMDHVFNMLEQYAGNLEEEVEERTKELIEEKKKSDILLYRMLPKQVAEKLKLGQSVEPETFECVTVFFSDIVSFTTLASRCTPLQVVNLLNDLYTLFDGIIAEYDVYKVETIGDGYLCVSGLPHRNGNDHAQHIANMSLGLIRSLDRFSIPHLPGERVSLRIGIHTGGCVAGVVGLAMPRYCLFGDTINTASRMESNGKPNRIHLSPDANYFLTHVIGGYITESRGEVIIKGKGVMETFWLIGTSNPEPDLKKNPPMYEDFRNRS